MLEKVDSFSRPAPQSVSGRYTSRDTFPLLLSIDCQKISATFATRKTRFEKKVEIHVTSLAPKTSLSLAQTFSTKRNHTTHDCFGGNRHSIAFPFLQQHTKAFAPKTVMTVLLIASGPIPFHEKHRDFFHRKKDRSVQLRSFHRSLSLYSHYTSGFFAGTPALRG